MKREAKRKWVKALESGRYKQTRENLENAGRFCCLGVLCKTQRIPIDENTKMDNDKELLGAHVLERVGLTDEQQKMLATMNDHGSPFKEIAAYIRKNL